MCLFLLGTVEEHRLRSLNSVGLSCVCLMYSNPSSWVVAELQFAKGIKAILGEQWNETGNCYSHGASGTGAAAGHRFLQAKKKWQLQEI